MKKILAIELQKVMEKKNKVHQKKLGGPAALMYKPPLVGLRRQPRRTPAKS